LIDDVIDEHAAEEEPRAPLSQRDANEMSLEEIERELDAGAIREERQSREASANENHSPSLPDHLRAAGDEPNKKAAPVLLHQAPSAAMISIADRSEKKKDEIVVEPSQDDQAHIANGSA